MSLKGSRREPRRLVNATAQENIYILCPMVSSVQFWRTAETLGSTVDCDAPRPAGAPKDHPLLMRKKNDEKPRNQETETFFCAHVCNAKVILSSISTCSDLLRQFSLCFGLS